MYQIKTDSGSKTMNVKNLVELLQKPPFNCNYSVISFDSLSSEDYLQILSDILQHLNDDPIIEIHLEDTEQTFGRIFNMLYVLRYKPFATADGDESFVALFRQKLISGEKSTIYPLLEWLLTNVETLRQRVYLARYLIKINIPSEILGHSDIASLHQQYLNLIEEFKKTHKENIIAQNDNRISISELRSDGLTMEKEKQIVSGRIDALMKKINTMPKASEFLQVCQKLRVEQDRKKEIGWQLQEELLNVSQSEQRLFRLNQQLQNFQKRSVGLSPQALMKKLEEEVCVTSYIVEQKLPRDLNRCTKEKEILENILYSENITHLSNEALDLKIQEFSQKVNTIVQGHLMASNNIDDKVVLFKQQAAIIARKKDDLAEKFSQLKSEIQEIRDKLQTNQTRLDEVVRENGAILRDNNLFQEYVNKFKARNNIYKRYRNDIAALKNENGILNRTLDILKSKAQKFGVNLEKISLRVTNTIDTDTSDVEKKGTSLVALITQLSASIATQKIKLGTFINELRPLKEEIGSLIELHEEKKKIYDKTNITLNTNLIKLSNEVKELEEKHCKIILEQGELEAQTHIAQVNLQRAKQEYQAVISKNHATILIQDRLTQKIAESEKVAKLLKEEQKQVRGTEKKITLQKNLWSNLHLLLDMKIKYLEQETEEMNNLMYTEKGGAETLVIH